MPINGNISRMTIAEFLDSFAVPVLLVNSDGIVQAINSAARVMPEWRDVEFDSSPTPGMILACSHAISAPGCGKTMHCVACTVRNQINATISSGLPQEEEPAVIMPVNVAGQQGFRYLVSTDKVEDYIILKIRQA